MQFSRVMWIADEDRLRKNPMVKFVSSRCSGNWRGLEYRRVSASAKLSDQSRLTE